MAMLDCGMTPCECGCGTPCAKRFVRGHNARQRQYPGETKQEGLKRRNVEYRQRLRNQALVAYGGETPTCACCGENEEAFLVLDHIANDGAAHRRALLAEKGWKQKRDGFGGPSFHRTLKALGWPDGLQVLCANCNMAKMRPEGCPHQTPVDCGHWHKD